MIIKQERKLLSKQFDFNNFNVNSLMMSSTENMETNVGNNVVCVANVGTNSSNNRRNFNSNQSTMKPQCTYCGKTGHTIDRCYEKHGYPPGYKARGKQFQQVSGQNQGQSSKNSFQGEVKKFGVTADQLKNLMAYFQSQTMVNSTHFNGSMSDQGNSTAAIVTPGNNSTQSGLQSKFLPLQNITDEGKFVSVVSVNGIVNNSSSSTWIIDTGATDHIVSSLHCYDSYRPVNDSTVKLPNGTTLVVDHIGDIQLSASILLKDVLHVSSFGLNLISASKLTKGSSCCLIVLDDYCFI